MHRYTKHAFRHLLVSGWRWKAAKVLFVSLMMRLTKNRFIRVLKFFGKGHWIFSGLPLMPEEIEYGKKLWARIQAEKAAKP